MIKSAQCFTPLMFLSLVEKDLAYGATIKRKMIRAIEKIGKRDMFQLDIMGKFYKKKIIYPNTILISLICKFQSIPKYSSKEAIGNKIQ